MSTLMLFHFAEPDGVRLTDSMGNVSDLAGAGAFALAWTGTGRDLEGVGATGTDLAGRNTLTTRDVTVQAIVATRYGDLVQGEIVRRGIGGSASERCAFGLEMLPDTSNRIYVRWFWETPGGTLKTQVPGVFEHAGDDLFFLVTATRRWESTTRVVCRYYVADEMIAEVVSADGDIGGATTGTTRVGHNFVGSFDDLKVTDHEMSHEEVRATWRRLVAHQRSGEEMFRGLIPPGASWARSPGNRIGRMAKAAGQALGVAIAKVEELRATWLPQTAYSERLAQWESILEVVPKPLDSLDVRRNRVVALEQREAGYSVPTIKLALEEPFALASADIEILEFTNTVTDDFATAIDTQRWHLEQAAQWTVLSGEARLQVSAAADIRWTQDIRNPCHARTSLSSGAGEIVVACKVASVPTFPTDVIVGLLLYSFLTGEAVWFGVRNDAGTYRIMRRSFLAGVVSEVVVATLGGGWTPASPLWLRIVGSQTTPGTYTLEYSTTSGSAGFVSTVVASLIVAPDWAGLSAVGLDASISSALDARFDDFLARTPNGDRPFHWYAYRDPLLAGEEDMNGAHLYVQKVKPAHTHAAAITSKSLLCDDAGSLCDHGPMGAL